MAAAAEQAAQLEKTPISKDLDENISLLEEKIAVQVGLFTAEVVMYVAIAMIGIFLTPSYESMSTAPSWPSTRNTWGPMSTLEMTSSKYSTVSTSV